MQVIKDQTLARIKAGVDVLADAVAVTMGPKGRNVVIKKEGLPPEVTKDGVTVAEAISELDDPLEDIGAEMVKEVATRAGKLAGDGTTTATILAQAMVAAGFRNIAAGSNPIDIKRGMDKAVAEVVEYLKEQSTQIELDSKEVRQIAAISANNDEELGDLFADAFDRVGKNGVVSIEKSPTHETKVDVVTGMQFDRGFVSPYFATDPTGKVCELENPMYVLNDGKITDMNQLIPIMTLAKKVNRPLVVIAEDIDGQALSQLLVNVLHKSLSSVAIKAPGYSVSRYSNLTDLGILTRSVLFSEKTDFTLDDLTEENIREEMFGGSDGITVERTSSVIVNGRGSGQGVDDRVLSLQSDVKKADSDHEKKQLESRIAKLSGGVGVIYIGANTPIEQKEKMARADDALCAVQAAIEEGIIDGGGATFLRAQQELSDDLDGDERIGYNIIHSALAKPASIIAGNAGETGEAVCAMTLQKPIGHGYNAKSGTLVNMKEHGIIDPTKVARVALESANSAAGMILLTECAIFQ